MAGMDYSKVIEPDYDPEKIRQTPEINQWIREVEKITLDNWQNRHKIKNQALGKDKFEMRSRNIYYDTDNIAERQNETIRICPDCSGSWQVDSSSDRGSHILAIHIPRKACKACRNLGYQWYDTADLKKFDLILLQDRTADTYQKRKK